MGVQVTGMQEALREHEAAEARARDLTPLLAVFRAELEAMVEAAWRSRTSPGGERWAPLRGASESEGGRLRSSVDVRVDRDDAIVIEVLVDHASWQFFGTSRVAARNPLPVEPRGGALAWMERGAAGAWMARMVERLVAYLATGEVTA